MFKLNSLNMNLVLSIIISLLSKLYHKNKFRLDIICHFENRLTLYFLLIT